MRSPMLRIVGSLFDALRQSRSRKRIFKEFHERGFHEIATPPIAELLPLRYPELIRDNSVLMFEKSDSQVLLFATAFTPRTRMPHRGRQFMLMCMPLGEDPKLASLSAALREPSEIYSVVDLLNLESYPSLSPLPDCTIFADSPESARHVLRILHEHKTLTSKGSLVVHRGRLLFQLPEEG